MSFNWFIRRRHLRAAGLPPFPCASMQRRKWRREMNERRANRNVEEAHERARLIEHQLDYLRAELLHLVHEREKLVYSASWHVFKPLRFVEAWLVDSVTAAYRRLFPARSAVKSAPKTPATRGSATPSPARRLLVDVTGTVKRDAGTGIQRVVKKVVQALYDGAAFDIPALAVRSENGRLLAANEFAASLSGAVPLGPDTEVSIEPGDRFFMLSDSWNAFEELAPVFDRIRAEGGEIVSCIFDLIPELYPHACHEVTVPRYDAWLRQALLESDSFIAISRTVAEELAAFVEDHATPHRPGLKIGWFHCCSDIVEGTASGAREKISAVVSGGAPVFLHVSTIEPRKGHRTALRAFEELWAGKLDAKLVFVGRRGWFEEAVVAEILGHAEYGRRLFWFDDIDDGELSFLYDRAAAIVFPSYAEGFGLPIVEAARRGRPVICSDIPVFREVGGEGAAYFRVNDPHALAESVRGWLAGAIATDPAKVLQTSWAEAARRIVEVIAREDWSRRLP